MKIKSHRAWSQLTWGVFTNIGITWSMLSSDDLDVMQTFLTLVTCDVTFYDDREDDEAAVDDDGDVEENDAIGHLVNDVLQLLLYGLLG